MRVLRVEVHRPGGLRHGNRRRRAAAAARRLELMLAGVVGAVLIINERLVVGAVLIYEVAPRGFGVAFVFVLREHRPIHGFEHLIVSHFKLCRVDGVVLDRI